MIVTLLTSTITYDIVIMYNKMIKIDSEIGTDRQNKSAVIFYTELVNFAKLHME